MSRRKTFTLAILVGFLIGAIFGYRGTRALAAGWDLLGNMASSAEYCELAFMQYRHATPQRGREALLGFVDYSKLVETMPNGKKDKVLLIDRGLTYMRLALLEEKAGNVNLSKQYAQAAQESYAAGGGKTHSDEDLRRLVTAVDTRIKY
jgi:hypothetical protein